MVMNMSKEINEFCYKYDATARPSTQVSRRYRRIPYSIWQTNPDVFQEYPVEDVPMVEITMPEDRFRALVETDAWLERLKDAHIGHGYAAVIRIVEEYEQESILRNQNPTLKDLYDQYQAMLRLIK